MRYIEESRRNSDYSTHTVMVIEYNDKPTYKQGPIHSVITHNDGRTYWDCFPIEEDEGDLRIYETGGGPIEPFEPMGRTFWAHPSVTVINQGNVKRLKYPRLIKIAGQASRNPFVIAEVTDERNNCDQCGIHFDTMDSLYQTTEEDWVCDDCKGGHKLMEEEDDED
jgi:hypothetical protein